MKLDSIYFNMLRAKAKGYHSSKEKSNRCAYEGCTRKGKFRAPPCPPTHHKKEAALVAPASVEWLYFCEEHISSYNQSYDYFEKMTADQVLEFIRNIDIGHRPTWRLGYGGFKAWVPPSHDSFYFFRSKKSNGGGGTDKSAPKALTSRHRRALETLGLEAQSSTQQIKDRFKALVKLYHPDLNGGDRKHEHRLAAVIDSYSILKKATP